MLLSVCEKIYQWRESKEEKCPVEKLQFEERPKDIFESENIN